MSDSISRKIIAKLREATIESFYSADRDTLTVKSVRNQVEKDLGLEPGFLRYDGWKKESRVRIESCVQELLKSEEREKNWPKVLKTSKNDSDDNLSVSETRFSTATTVKQNSKKCSRKIAEKNVGREKRQKTAPSTRQSEERSGEIFQQVSSQLDSDSNEQEYSTKDNQRLVSSSKYGDLISLRDYKLNSYFEDEKNQQQQIEKLECFQNKLPMNLISHHTTVTKVDETVQKDAKPQLTDDANDLNLSVGIDEPLPLIHKKKRKQGNAVKSVTVITERKERNKVSKHNSQKQQKKKIPPEETRLKKLQNQLRKCGVTTIWQFELKKYGDDVQAKLRHLESALKVVGMTGRFSNSRAKKIKISRELMADLQAVNEGEIKWGSKRNKRDNVDDKEDKEDIKKGKRFSLMEDDNICDKLNDEREESSTKNSNDRRRSLRNKSLSDHGRQYRRSTDLDWLGTEEDSED